MIPDQYRTTLAVSLNAADVTTTELYVDHATTVQGETISYAGLSPFSRFVLVVDPRTPRESDVLPEVCTATGFDAVNKKFTGVTRGMSSISNAQNVDNITFHGVGAEVIISFGLHNIADLLDYINAVISGGLGAASDTTAGATKLTETMASGARARIAGVSQTGVSGSMALIALPIRTTYSGGIVNFAGATTTSYTAPTGNPRRDILCYNVVTSALAYRTGSEAVTPTAPSVLFGDIPLCQIYHRVGEVAILERSNATDGYIEFWFEPKCFEQSSTQVSNAVVRADANGNVVYPSASCYTLGENCAIRDSLYIKEADGKAYKLSGSTQLSDMVRFVGFATTAGTTGNTICAQDRGGMSGFTGLIAGKRYYAGTTAGSISLTDTVSKYAYIGTALSATMLNIDNVDVISFPGTAGSSSPLVYSNDSSVSTGAYPSNTWTKVKEILVSKNTANMYVRAEGYTTSAGAGTYDNYQIQLWKNGVAVGSIITVGSNGATASLAESLSSIVATDLVQVYARKSVASGNPVGNDSGVRNFRLYYDYTKETPVPNTYFTSNS